MKLIDFCNKYYSSRKQCSAAWAVSTFQLNNWICANRDVELLADGRWILVNQKNKYLRVAK